MKYKLFIFLTALIFVLTVVNVANSSNHARISTLTQIYQYGAPNQGSLNQLAPPDCINEDDHNQRIFSGSLYGSYSTTFEMCGEYYNGMYWDAGGEGLQSQVTVNGNGATDITITAPDGTIRHSVQIGRGNYEVCWSPPYYAANNTGSNPLMRGTWTITLSTSASQVSWEAQNTMTDVYFQRYYCPVSEQNIIY